MRDEFYENSVGPQNDRQQKTLLNVYNVLFVIAICFFVISLYFLLLTFDSGFIILTILAVIFCVSLFFLKRKLYTFYDYTYISGEVRVVKVINGKSRRKFMVFDCKKVKRLGKVGSETFNSLHKSGKYKLKVATPNGLNSQNQLYYLLIQDEAEDVLLILECQEKFLVYVVSVNGKSIIEKDYA